jgi:hypothetical protein
MSTFGITAVTGTLIESVSASEKADVSVIHNNDGTYGAAQVYDRKQSFSVKGRGDTLIMPGSNTGAPTVGISGAIFVTNSKLSSSNTEFQSFEYSGEAYPTASA